jgi:hypothetical protein
MPLLMRWNVFTAALLVGLAAISGRAQAQLETRPPNRPLEPVQAVPPVEPFTAEGRLTLNPIGKALMVAEANEVPLELHGFQPTVIVASWFDPKRGLPVGKETSLTLMHRPNGTAYVNVVPTRSGRLQLALFTMFTDGGIDSQEIDVQVVFPKCSPSRLVVNLGVGDDARNEGTVYVELKQTDRVALYAGAVYDVGSRPVPIPAENIAFRVETAPGETPPIEINPATGKLRALHLGEALVDATFAGVTRQTCVVVRQAREGGASSGCERLLLSSNLILQNNIQNELKDKIQNGPIALPKPIEILKLPVSAPGAPK